MMKQLKNYLRAYNNTFYFEKKIIEFPSNQIISISSMILQYISTL